MVQDHYLTKTTDLIEENSFVSEDDVTCRKKYIKIVYPLVSSNVAIENPRTEWRF